MDVDPCAAPRSQIVPKATDLTALEQAGGAWSEPTHTKATTQQTVNKFLVTQTEFQNGNKQLMNTQNGIHQETPSSVDSLFVCNIPDMAGGTLTKPTTVSTVVTPLTVNDMVAVTTTESKNATSLFCDVCNVSCNSGDMLKKHKEGKKHLKNTEKLSVSSTIIQNTTSSIQCELCGIWCTSHDMFDKHILGRKHKNKAKTLLQDPKEGNNVFAERSKRKLADDDSSVASGEDADTKRLKMIKEDRGSSDLLICRVCNVACEDSVALNTHVGSSEHSAMVLEIIIGGRSKQQVGREVKSLANAFQIKIAIDEIRNIRKPKITNFHSKDSVSLNSYYKSISSFICNSAQFQPRLIQNPRRLGLPPFSLLMSTCSSSGSSFFVDDEELLQFEARCKELRIEKDMLKQSSFELIRSLESHARTSSETRSNDKKRIQDLERELSNCSQELDYLQDQLTARDTEINRMIDYIQSLELKVKAKEDLDLIMRNLEQELKACKSENLALMKKLEDKEHELYNSKLCVDKLEESISNIALDFQCDIESMRLDLMAMEHSFFEAKELQNEAATEHRRMQELTKNYKIQMQNVARLVEENKELREKLKTFESIADSETKMMKSNEYEAQIHEYELLVNQLKEQLKDEKFKANEEAEDLAQEMAELRYQLTGLLEEEYKKRACIEQRALQRITELESQIEKERRKTFADVRVSFRGSWYFLNRCSTLDQTCQKSGSLMRCSLVHAKVK
ncbi:hypothetical protein L1987_66662 [Smallanthus sonchifolius]|uniref:Uncharacterized protein n=1 Tax=Smallanthus sonchifolius TaxID=185202 RepID=A0ACB9BXR7_9ASTR|nr:hypothetical protein L1987_66662 [Smallanthus sonchifolius]